jgi:hypothetical protein
LLGLFLILFFTTARAQFKASIQGTVADASGAIIPNAAITVTNIETGHELLVIGSEAGFYRVSALAPGKYTLSVERQGFKKKIIKEIVVNAEEERGVNIVLEPGELTDAVTITGEAISQLQTENANVDRNITTLEVLRLPQFGRDPYELVRLTPGVFGQGARSGSGGAVNLPNTTGPGGSSTSVFQVENQVPVSANGQRVSNNNFQLDGVSVNSLGWGGAAVVTPNQESVKELKVLSSSYSAEDGRNSGAQIKVVSQNGTNTFHGSGFFKYSEPGLNAFNKYGGTTGNVNINAPPVRVERRFRQFGGSLGGPIYLPRFGEGGPAYWSGQNRLFFFFSYEGLREKTNNTFNTYVETPEYRASVLQLRANSVTAGVLRASGVEPRISQLLPVDCGIYGNNAARCRVVPGGLDIGSITGATGQYVPKETGGDFDGIPDLQFAHSSIQFKRAEISSTLVLTSTTGTTCLP